MHPALMVIILFGFNPRIPQHKASLTDDYAEVKKLADENKKQKEYEKWISTIKSKIYWEVRI